MQGTNFDIYSSFFSDRTVDMLANGVPAIIAFFLILYAHRALSTRLSEATEKEHDENAALYRQQLRWVWRVALVLLVVHATANIWPSFDWRNSKSVYTGYIDNLETGTSVTVPGVERFHSNARPAAGQFGQLRTEWVVLHSQRLDQLVFQVVTGDDRRFECHVASGLSLGRDMYFQAIYKGGKKLSAMRNPTAGTTDFVCHPGDLQFDAPKIGAPTDLSALPEPAAGPFAAPLFGLIPAAHAQAQGQPLPLDELLVFVESDSFELRQQARDHMAQHFEAYKDWAEAVAAGTVEATDRQVGALTWAVSRRRAEPWRDPQQAPDFSENLTSYVLHFALNDSEFLRDNAKRFAISYPSADMAAKVEDIAAHSSEATEGYAADLQAHFAYNQGVYHALAAEAGSDQKESYSAALAQLSEAETYVAALPEDEALKYAKIKYARGWVSALGAQANLGDQFSESAAEAEFKSFLDQVKDQEENYRYPWQIERAGTYVSGQDRAF